MALTDFDVLARLRRLEAENDKLKDRVGQLERNGRQYHDVTEYRRPIEITDHEAFIAMVHAMRPREDRKD